MKNLNNKITVYIVFCIALFFVALFTEISNLDFNKAYYPIAKSILERGSFVYTYGGMKNLPLIGWLLVPFAVFKLEIAQWLLIIVELFTYAAAFYVFSEYIAVTIKNRWLALFLFIACRPFFIALFFGQLTFLAFLLLLIMIVAFLKGHSVATGGLLTSVFLMKIPPGILLFYFLRKKEYQAVNASIVSYTLFVIASILIFGWQLHLDWFKFVVLLNVGATMGAYNNQTFSSLVLRYIREFDPYSWYPTALHPTLHVFILLILGGTILWFLLRMKATRQQPELIMIEISIVICLFLVAFPLVWDHYYLFLIFSYFILIDQLFKRGNRTLWILTALSFIMSNPPVYIFFNPETPYRLLNVTLMSSPVLGNLLLTFLLELMRLRCLAVQSSSGEASLKDSGEMIPDAGLSTSR